MRHFKLFTLFFILALLITHSSKAAVYAVSDTAKDTNKQKKADSSKVKVVSKKTPLNSKVDYHARDSIRLDAKKRKVYLYGDADVKYENLELKAAYIDISLDSNIAFATGIQDSGKTIGKPEFHQGSDVFHAEQIRYNFKSKKGRINQITTKEGEGFIQGKIVKKDSSNVFYMKNGRYTTCSEEADPHFFIAAYRLKVIPNKQVVTGPAMLVIEGVPTPLAIPFGFFPLTNGRHSGLIIPSYGESQSQGFYLLDGGYYLGLSDHFDMQVRGDIYTNGSYGIRDIVDYSNRYHYSGEFKVGYSDTRLQIPESPAFSNTPNFLVLWQHTQDSKARPNSNFSASVNAGTTNYYTTNSYSPDVFLQNTMQSNIAFSQNFPQTPFHLTLNAASQENTINTSIQVTLPELTFTADRVYPAKLIENWMGTPPLGNGWLITAANSVSVAFSTNAMNSVTAPESTFLKESTLKHMQNGINSSIPLSANVQFFKYITCSPNLTFSAVNYFQYTNERWNPINDSIKIDTLHGLRTALTYNLSIPLTTNIYATYSLGKKKAVIIRQVFYPTVSYNYHPDFGAASYGYWKKVQEMPPYGQYQPYSIFQNGIYGGPATGKYSVLGFSLATNLEMKVRVQTDSGTVYKKIKLLERFSISSGYNLATPDSMPWSDITLAGSTTLFKKLAINFSGTIDPYELDYQGNNINAWDFSKSLGRLINGELSFSTTLSGAKGGTKNKDQQGNATAAQNNSGLQLSSPNDYFTYEQMHPMYWAPIEIAPWSLTMFYNMLYDVQGFAKTTTQTVMFTGSMQLTKFWYFSVNSGYDISNSQFTSTALSARRDMHCWQLDFSTVPFGFHQSFTLSVHVKASVLQDLKLQRTRGWTDTQVYSQ